jgi:hypothetical protein
MVGNYWMPSDTDFAIVAEVVARAIVEPAKCSLRSVLGGFPFNPKDCGSHFACRHRW